MPAGFNYNLKKQGGKGCHDLGFHEHAWQLEIIKAHIREKENNRLEKTANLAFLLILHFCTCTCMHTEELHDKCHVSAHESSVDKAKRWYCKVINLVTV